MNQANLITEEDIRTKVVYTWLAGHGFQPHDILLEHAITIRLGRGLVKVEAGEATKVSSVGKALSESASRRTKIGARSDILARNSEGKNLFILEIKAPGEVLDNDARDQGISYARLLADGNIPPFTILTNGTQTKIFDSLTKEEIDGQQIPLKHPHVTSGFCITGTDLLLRQEALEKLITLSPENLLLFCAEQSHYRMHRLRSEDINSGKKYIPSLYVEREKPHKMLADCLDRQRKPIVIVTGPPQVGKTNFLCHFVEDRISQGYPSLFYPAVGMQKGLLQEICDDFEWILGDYHACSRFVHEKLRNILGRSQKTLTLFIDGWNETSRELARLIDSDVERAVCNTVQIVVSFTNSAADRLLLDHAGNPSCIGDLASINIDGVKLIRAEPELMKSGHSSNVVPIGKYDNDEMKQAYQKYCAAYNVSVPESHHRVREPYLLGVAMKLSQNRRLPEVLEEPDLLGRFIDYKINRAIGLDEYNPRLILVKLAEEMFANGRPVDIGTAVQTWGLPPVARVPVGLIDAALLTEILDAGQVQSIDFYYDREREFIIAYWALGWLDKIQKGERVDSIFDSLRTSVGMDAMGWFMRQVQHLPFLKTKEGKLPVYSEPQVRRLFIESLVDIVAHGKQHDAKEWLNYAKQVSTADSDPLVKIEALKLLSLLCDDDEDVEELASIFPDNERLEGYIVGVLSISEKYPFLKKSVGEIVLKAMTKLHRSEYFYNLDDSLSESGISKVLKIIIDRKCSPIIYSAALSCLAYSAPELYLKMFSEKKAVLSRGRFEQFSNDYLTALRIAVSQIEEILWPEGCWGCPDVEELFSEDEYLSWETLIAPIITHFRNYDSSERLKQILAYVASHIEDDEEHVENDEKPIRHARQHNHECYGTQLTILEEIQKIKIEKQAGADETRWVPAAREDH